MNHCGELVGRLRKDIHSVLLTLSISLISALTDKACEAGEALRPAERLQIFVEQLIGRGNVGSLLYFHGIGQRRCAVDLSQIRSSDRTVAVAMAGVTSDDALAAEIR